MVLLAGAGNVLEGSAYKRGHFHIVSGWICEMVPDDGRHSLRSGVFAGRRNVSVGTQRDCLPQIGFGLRYVVLALLERDGSAALVHSLAETKEGKGNVVNLEEENEEEEESEETSFQCQALTGNASLGICWINGVQLRLRWWYIWINAVHLGLR